MTILFQGICLAWVRWPRSQGVKRNRDKGPDAPSSTITLQREQRANPTPVFGRGSSWLQVTGNTAANLGLLPPPDWSLMIRTSLLYDLSRRPMLLKQQYVLHFSLPCCLSQIDRTSLLGPWWVKPLPCSISGGEGLAREDLCDGGHDNGGVELRSLKTGLAEESLSALYSVVKKSGKRSHERAGEDVLPDSGEHERPAGVISKVIFIGCTQYQFYAKLQTIAQGLKGCWLKSTSYFC